MKLEYLKPGHCPLCNCLLPYPANVNITLNNGTVMQQPVCVNDFPKMLAEKTQKELLSLCKLVWIEEIATGTQRTEEEKNKEIENINKLEVMYD